jgi:hypothetical protein
MKFIALREKLREEKVFPWYRSFFSISEIEDSKILQWVYGAILLGFYVTFFDWVASSNLTVERVVNGTHLCWPFFQNCGDFYFLSSLPYGYTQTTLYAFLFAVMLLAVLAVWIKDWILAHMLMMILFLWELLAMFLSMSFSANYWYFHLTYTAILLFIPYKLFFLRFTFVFFYFLAGSVKIHSGWILGTYFSSLQTGLPIFPDVLIPLITNLVIFAEIVGSWFLFSSRWLLQRAALAYFTIFHLYSGVIVKYIYPTIVLPLLLILFVPLYQKEEPPWNLKALFGWVLVIFLLGLQSISWFIPGDVKLTLEGNYYGLYMFEANHQCVSTAKVYHTDGSVEKGRIESDSARNRCDPYRRWFRLRQICERGEEVERISWQFDHSINGGPFYRIVDEENICVLTYKPFRHNEWIRLPENGALKVGYPVKNYYY